MHWQLNKGWPTLLWDLYNEEYDEAGSYFGAKEANAGVHALFAYDTRTVTLDDLLGAPAAGVTALARVYTLGGQLLDEQSAGPLTLAAGSVQTGVLDPTLPAATHPPQAAQTYLLELLVSREGTVVDRNVYWLSTQEDEVDWAPLEEGEEPEPQAAMSQYASLSALHELAPATLSVSAHTAAHSGPAGANRLTSVTITNVSTTPTVAFFLRADVRRGDAAGAPEGGDDEVLPTYWSANDTTLWPGESETLEASYNAAALDGSEPVVSVSGWNVGALDVPAQEG